MRAAAPPSFSIKIFSSWDSPAFLPMPSPHSPNAHRESVTSKISETITILPTSFFLVCFYQCFGRNSMKLIIYAPLCGKPSVRNCRSSKRQLHGCLSHLYAAFDPNFLWGGGAAFVENRGTWFLVEKGSQFSWPLLRGLWSLWGVAWSLRHPQLCLVFKADRGVLFLY